MKNVEKYESRNDYFTIIFSRKTVVLLVSFNWFKVRKDYKIIERYNFPKYVVNGLM